MKRLIALLPIVNYMSLMVIIAHLIRVVQNSEKNKMNVRNISIVFSPTLGIPAGIFTLMMAEFPTVFETTPEIDRRRKTNFEQDTHKDY
jgi:RalA-binding protein 1